MSDVVSGHSTEADYAGEVWNDGPTALGTVPTPAGPGAPRVRHHASGTSAAGNVRLDRPEHLARQVNRRGEAESDVELVLAAYAKWGPSFVDHLQGAFAFVVWDPDSRRLLAARDPFGREPLFFHDGSDGMAVASQLNVLRRLPPVSEQLDERRVADFLMFVHEDRKATFYTDIRRLSPGHLLVASSTGTTIQQYRRLSPADDVACTSDDEYAEAYRHHLFRAVRRAMRGSGRVGTWLSGGLDSSSVTCMARDVLPDSEVLPTFSLTFDAVPESDEQGFIEAVHREGSYDPHFVSGDKEGPLDISDKALRALGEPFTTPNLFMTTTLLRAARDAGVGIALDGFLGDSITGHGTRRVTELVLNGRWLTAARELGGAAQQLGPSWATYRRLLHQFVVRPLLTGPLSRTYKDLSGVPAGDDLARSVVQPDLLRQVNWDDRARMLGADRDRVPLREQAAHKREVTSGKLSLAVETAVRMGRQLGVSVRFPFADEDLISFCLALPSRQKCREGWTRVVAREALSDLLPEEIAQRYGKASLGPVFNRAFFELNGDRLRSILRNELEEARAFLRPDAVRQLYRRCTRGEASQDEVAVLWNAVLLTRWIASRQSTDKRPTVTRSSPKMQHLLVE